jgi:iron complex transport system permease protein
MHLSSPLACSHPEKAMPRVRVSVWAGLLLSLALAFVLELSLGSVLIPFESVLSILLGTGDPPEGWRQIVLLFRLPRALAAMLGGAALGMAGLKMQTLFRNPLADPFVLGISSGASLGVAVLVMAVWGAGWPGLLKKAGILGDLSLILSATLGAMGVLVVVLGVARRVESNLTLLIVGIMFGYMSGALVSILMQFTHEQQIRVFVSWTFGSFGGVTWRQMPLYAAMLLSGLVLGWALSKPLNGLLLGEGYARSMGIDVRRTKFWIIIGAALLAGTVTATCGPIGFLGIAIPHLCRLLMRTSDHHVLAPGVILLGATLALSADLLSQVPGTRIVLPLNAVTALMGAPVVVAVLLRRNRAMEVAP